MPIENYQPFMVVEQPDGSYLRVKIKESSLERIHTAGGGDGGLGASLHAAPLPGLLSRGDPPRERNRSPGRPAGPGHSSERPHNEPFSPLQKQASLRALGGQAPSSRNLIPKAYFVPKTYYKLKDEKYVFFFEMRLRCRQDMTSFVFKYFFIEKSLPELLDIQSHGVLLQEDSLVYPLDQGVRGLRCGQKVSIERLKEEWFREEVQF